MSAFSFAPTTSDPGERASHTRRIKAWVQDYLELPDHVMIMVAELTCNDPDCAPLETCITVWYTESHKVQATIFKPLCTVMFDDIGSIIYQLTQ
jgi:hypothetical protein